MSEGPCGYTGPGALAPRALSGAAGVLPQQPPRGGLSQGGAGAQEDGVEHLSTGNQSHLIKVIMYFMIVLFEARGEKCSLEPGGKNVNWSPVDIILLSMGNPHVVITGSVNMLVKVPRLWV